MKRREFITFLGSAAVAWPLAAHAQQPALPMVGFLGSGSPQSDAFRMAAIRQGLNESGYVEGRNVAFEYRWAEDHNERLPALAGFEACGSAGRVFSAPGQRHTPRKRSVGTPSFTLTVSAEEDLWLRTGPSSRQGEFVCRTPNSIRRQFHNKR